MHDDVAKTEGRIRNTLEQRLRPLSWPNGRVARCPRSHLATPCL